MIRTLTFIIMMVVAYNAWKAHRGMTRSGETPTINVVVGTIGIVLAFVINHDW